MKILASRCPACRRATIPVSSRLFAALRSSLRCPACGASVRLSLWPRVVHIALGELAVASGFTASWVLGTPLYLALGSASWFGFGLALPLSEASAPGAAAKPRPGAHVV